MRDLRSIRIVARELKGLEFALIAGNEMRGSGRPALI
jgi:hypothetical protein